MAPTPNRRDLIKLGAAAGGIAVAGPVVTTFNVPAAATLTSIGCSCTADKTIIRKEYQWFDPFGLGFSWIPVPTTSANCTPSCWQVQVQSGNGFIFQTSSVTQNSSITISRGLLCNDDADEGIFQVTALYAGTGLDCVASPEGDGTISFDQSTATVTAQGGKTIIRVFVVACC